MGQNKYLFFFNLSIFFFFLYFIPFSSCKEF